MTLKNVLNISNREGITWQDYRKVCTPNFYKVALELFLCYSMFGLGFYLLVQSKNFQPLPVTLISLFVIALWLGYWLHAILCFFHEAAHFNIAPKRSWNDCLANILMGIFFGIKIDNYRFIHLQHHQKLGKTNDPENSYYTALSLPSILMDITGLYLVKKLFFKKLFKDKHYKQKRSQIVFFLMAISIHLSIVAYLALCVSVFACLAWLLSLFSVFPLCNRIRQTLEHRSFTAEPKVDYGIIEHGETLRLFGKDFISRTFGAAGFNEHLYHHLDPTISYTNFDKMALFFKETSINTWLEDQRTSYVKAFKQLCTWR